MYTTSEGYKKANIELDRTFESNVTVGSRKLTNEDIISFTIEQSIQQDDTFTIGNNISSCLNLTFFHDDIETDDKDIVNLKLGLLTNNTYEYIPLGIYNIYSISSSDTTTTLLCYDNMIKFDKSYVENNENPTLYSVINRLTELTGVSFGGTLTDYKNYQLSQLQGYSCREVLGFIAGVLGSNAIIDRNGKFNFVSISIHPLYNIERFELATKDGSIVMTKNSEVIEVKAQVGFVNANSYYDYTKKNKNYKITQVINATDTEEISLGSLYDDTVYLYMQNPLVDEEILKDIYSKLNGLEFLPYSLNWSGDISIDLGDLVTVTDKKGVMRAHPVLSQSITYNGALNTVLNANGDTKLANTYVTKTKEEAELDRTQEDLEDTKEEISNVKVEINQLSDSIELKVEKSEMEDIKEDVSYIKEDISSINIDLDGITQKVSNVETTTIDLTKNVDTVQSIANSKAKVFTSTPTIPYEVGDLWVQGTSGEIMRCKTTRTSGSYTDSDWEKASKYTDDTIANANKAEISSTKSKVAEIETNLSSITQRVSSTEKTILEIDGEVFDLESRISSAEQKITADAIISTVETTINNARDNAINSANSTTDSKLQNYATTTALSTVSQKADQISWVVKSGTSESNMTLTDALYSLITENIKLKAKNISLEGLVTANNNFKINLDGSIEAVNGKFTGNISGSNITGSSMTSTSKTDASTKVAIDNGNISIVSKDIINGNDTQNIAMSIGNGGIIIGDTKIANGYMYSPSPFIMDFPIETDYNMISNSNIQAGQHIRAGNELQVLNPSSGGWVRTAVYNSSGDYLHYGLPSSNVLLQGSPLNLKGTTLRLGCGDASIIGSSTHAGIVHFTSYDSGSGTQVYAFRPTTTNATLLGSASNRWQTIYSVNSLSVSSDRNAKENIKYVQDDNISTLSVEDTSNITLDGLYNFVKDDLFLTTFNYKENNKKTVGFIAQDMLQAGVYSDDSYNIANTIVEVDEENNLSYDTGAYINTLAGALKKAIEKIESLENKIEELENKISKMEV